VEKRAWHCKKLTLDTGHVALFSFFPFFFFSSILLPFICSLASSFSLCLFLFPHSLSFRFVLSFFVYLLLSYFHSFFYPFILCLYVPSYNFFLMLSFLPSSYSFLLVFLLLSLGPIYLFVLHFLFLRLFLILFAPVFFHSSMFFFLPSRSDSVSEWQITDWWFRIQTHRKFQLG
jgi:hypothetical protein